MAPRLLPLSCLYVLMCVLGGVARADDCHPSCDGADPGTILPDPTDCTKFHVCLPGGTVFTDACDEGQEYDSDTQMCVAQGTAKCLECEPSCRYICPSDDSSPTFTADWNDCSLFHICPHGGMAETEMSCPGVTPYFNGAKCTTEASQCCDPCITYCWETGVTIPDPTDCRSFYLCTEIGRPTGDSLHCSEGNYDFGTGVCSATAPCHQPCQSL